jgi:hypothetical protein
MLTPVGSEGSAPWSYSTPVLQAAEHQSTLSCLRCVPLLLFFLCGPAESLCVEVAQQVLQRYGKQLTQVGPWGWVL